MSSFQFKVANKVLRSDTCCGKGCKKCPYGRWLKRRSQTWPVLVDEWLKMQHYGWWLGIIIMLLAIILSNIAQ